MTNANIRTAGKLLSEATPPPSLFKAAYNTALIPIAAGLFYPALYLWPELAGLAMALSSISVTLNSLRLRKA